MSARLVVAAFLALAASGAGAQEGARLAQLYNQPPLDIPDEPGPPPAPPPRDAALSLRLDRLEREMRQMTGKVEELEHQVQVLEEQARSRPADRGGVTPGAAAPAPGVPAAAPAGNSRRGDAFDPAAEPDAAGAPRPLGTTSPSAPSPRAPARTASPSPQEPGAPLDLTHGRLAQEAPAPGAAAPLGAPAEAAPAQPSTRSEYDQAVASLRSGQYEAAEKAFSGFISRNPKSKYAPAATFNLGESFYLRGRHREAAERYLEVSTKFGQSAQAPDAMLRLGQALYALGAKEQACASFSEIGVKYPNASARVKDAAEREQKKLQC